MGNFKNIPELKRLITENGTKITIYFGVNEISEDSDPYEKKYAIRLLNPKTIKGYVTEISPEKLVWKKYGLEEMGAVEILCEEKYDSWFRNCHKIIINDKEYCVFKEGVGKKAVIQSRPGKIIRVVLSRKG